MGKGKIRITIGWLAVSWIGCVLGCGKDPPVAAAQDATVAEAAGSDAANSELAVADGPADTAVAEVVGPEATAAEIVQPDVTATDASSGDDAEVWDVAETTADALIADGQAPDASTADTVADTAPPPCAQDTDCAGQEDSNACNGTLYCDKPTGLCLVNPATIVQCGKGGDTTCLKAACVPATGACALAPVKDGTLCNDANKCTEGDVCIGGACSGGEDICVCKVNADCVAQDDGNLCNGTLFCNKATTKCQLNPTTIVNCQTVDDTACIHNLCQPKTGKCAMTPVATGLGCDDGNPCTPNEACDDGQCTATANLCQCAKDADCLAKDDGNLCNGLLYCDLKQLPHVCALNPATVVTCPSVDDSACSQNVCAPKTGKCDPVPLPDGATCEADGNPCTQGDSCKKGICAASASICECQSDGDCAVHEDGNPCNGTLYCNKVLSKCLVNPATIVQCPFGGDTECLRNLCEPSSGQCKMQPFNGLGPCDADGNPCTPYDQCQNGACVASANVCDCQKSADCAGKEDQSLCNGTLFCDTVALKCIVNPATVVNCPDAGLVACVRNQCDPATGTCSPKAANENKWCDGDANPCTLNDTCKNGNCQLGNNICACDLDSHCDGKDDGKLCNGTLYCDKAALPFGCAVASATIVKCAPGQDTTCLANKCQSATGKCAMSPAKTGTACDDGMACTVGESCQLGLCSGSAKICDDKNACTLDNCQAESGVCLFTEFDCDDGKTCTSNACDPAKGCVFTVKPGPCASPDLCDANETCQSDGSCKGGPKLCDDGDVCTTDSCDPKTGCVFTPHTNACTYGNKCLEGMLCKDGTCQGGSAPNCDDGLACTTDACQPGPGCIHTPNNGLCNDNDPCTTNTCDAATGCKYPVVVDATPCATNRFCSAGLCVWATQIGVGHDFACALRADGTVWCWGRGDEGQLGNGKTAAIEGQTVFSTSPAQVAGVAGATAISVGFAAACAVTASGQALCWGFNGSKGFLGTGDLNASVLQPKAMKGLNGVAAVAVGYGHHCATLQSGDVYCAGDNATGALALAGTAATVASTPAKSQFAAPQSVAVGADFTCAVQSGKVFCAGDNQVGQIGTGSLTTAKYAASSQVAVGAGVTVAAGERHACTVLASGKVACWGACESGQLGNGKPCSGGAAPGPVEVALAAKAIAVSAAAKHTCAITDSGDVYCWGANGNAQLGDGGAYPQPLPQQVVGLPAAVSVSAGDAVSCARDKQGQAWCWGSGSFGALGDNQDGAEHVLGTPQLLAASTAEPSTACHFKSCDDGNPCTTDTCDAAAKCVSTPTPDGTPCGGNFCHKGTCKWAVDLAVGFEHSCALRGDGSAVCWGRNTKGQLGSGSIGGSNPLPGAVSGASGGISISARNATTCIVQKSGKVQCWGGGDSCQMGGTVGDKPQATTVTGMANIAQVAVGNSHLCATQTGTTAVFCVGSAASGELGDVKQSFDPVCTVTTATGAKPSAAAGKLAAGNAFTVGTNPAGDFLFWGNNEARQLSMNYQIPYVILPKTEALATAWLQVTAGDAFTCAVTKGDNKVRCWGDNSKGQVTGKADNLGAYGMTVPSGSATAYTVSGGATHSCSVTTNKTVQCWGSNGSGQLGNGTAPVAGTVAVSGLKFIDKVVAGKSHSCALDIVGQVWCWGSDTYGELGDGQSGAGVQSNTPLVVPASVASLTGPLCAATTCDDKNSCTTDLCHPATGKCSNTPVGDGTACGGSGLGQICASGQCKTPFAVQLALGNGFTCVRRPTGAVQCAGRNDFAALGASLAIDESFVDPQVVTGFETGGAVSITAKENQACAVRDDGKVLCWGSLKFAALGVGGNQGTVSTPQEVLFLADRVGVAMGVDTACAWDANGEAACWGLNDYGQAGVGKVNTVPKQSMPAKPLANALTGVAGISIGQNHGCARTAANALWCWGDDTGALGTASPANAPTGTPAQISGVTAVGLATLDYATFVIDGAGSVRAAAKSGSATITGHYAAKPTNLKDDPVVPVLAQVAQIAAGQTHACARLQDGRVACWGSNAMGESAASLLQPTCPQPAIVHGVAAVAQVYAGSDHSCVLHTNGAVACWGSNVYAQFGTGAVAPGAQAGVTEVGGTGPQ